MDAKTPDFSIDGRPTQPTIREQMSNEPRGSQFNAMFYSGKMSLAEANAKTPKMKAKKG